MTWILSSCDRSASRSDRSPVRAWLALVLAAFVVAGCADTGPLRETPTDPFGGIHGQ